MSEHKYEKFTEKEEAVVEGIDISGVWNRMYEPRELTESLRSVSLSGFREFLCEPTRHG